MAVVQVVARVPGSVALDAFLRRPIPEQLAALDDAFSSLVHMLIRGGWTPLDIGEFARRRVREPVGAHLLGLVATETARHDPATVAPEWQAQLGDVQAVPGSGEWARRTGLAWPDACAELIELLAAYDSPPALQVVMAPPGHWRRASAPIHGVDKRMLAKVRALLAKAESTDFDEEADALTAKAQQLMTEHSIDRAVAQSTDSARPAPGARRLWLDAPYADAKAVLVDNVARHNRASCIMTTYGFVTLVGFADDLDTIELLTTSLLVQATRAMQLVGQATRSAMTRSRSFRRSFLLSYAGRIGERLAEAVASTESRADAERGGSLLPILAARTQQVSSHVDELFPHLVAKSFSSGNLAGWGAGRAAADLARLQVHDEIERAG